VTNAAIAASRDECDRHSLGAQIVDDSHVVGSFPCAAALDSNGMVAPSRIPATLEDLLAQGDPDRLEIIGGEIFEKAIPSPRHSRTEIKLGVAVDPFNRKPGRHGPGGWWVFTEIHTDY
jgi:hypothetical protein